MKLLAALLCLLLTGCGTSSALPSEPPQAPTVSLRTAYHPLTQRTGGIVEVFSPGAASVLCSFGRGLLLSDGEALTLYAGDDLTGTAQAPNGTVLESGSGRLYVYDSAARQIRILDNALSLLDTLSLPQDCVGIPGISQDGAQVYYLLQDGLYLWEPADGRTRVLRSNLEVRDGSVRLLGDTLLLQLTAPNGQTQTQLISREDGGSQYGNLCPQDAALLGGTLAIVSAPNAFCRILLLRESPQRLNTQTGESFLGFLPALSAVVTGESTQEGLLLRLYALDRAQCLGSLCLPDVERAWDFCLTEEGGLYFLAKEAEDTLLLRWHYDAFPPQSRGDILLPYWASPSDSERLRSAARAARLEEAYGLTILLYEDATQAMPWDYSLTPSAAADETDWTLETLDSLLGLLPEGFLSRLSPFRLCLVGSIQGTAASGSLAYAQGLQFQQDGIYYVALATAPAEELRYTLFHELSHLIDTQVMGTCSAYDDWQDLNPQGFTYSQEAQQYASYLTGTNRCFVDDYAMTTPSEDRARIFECAMNPGNEDLFTPPLLQQKLRRLCVGIRKAFDLEGEQGSYIWEQYLVRYAGES